MSESSEFSPKIDRRKAIFLSGAAAAGVAIGAGKPFLEDITGKTQGNNESGAAGSDPAAKVEAEQRLYEPVTYLKRKDDEDATLYVSDHPDYLKIADVRSVQVGDKLLFPNLHTFSKDDPIAWRESPSKTVEPDQFAENVCAVRIGLKQDNEAHMASFESDMEIPDPKDPRRLLHVWLALADSNNRDAMTPTWVDNQGNKVDQPIVLSPIFTETASFDQK